MTDQPIDDVNARGESASDTSDDDPTPALADLPDDIANGDLSSLHLVDDGVPTPGDLEDPAPGVPLGDDEVGMLELVEED